ncbi:hypothetical protein [Methylobacterium iners]|uniref:Uncharacterized protein n=1 Tax=Methylobacterium iners TaxID=418707 RepID=A0ABQ4S1D6_9HYPH|nr:hypothetical protein [Methylobacterium iners]GJD95729.1 hypothetical protein OCOJLMKI_2943 [Methylobacterium iners]
MNRTPPQTTILAAALLASLALAPHAACAADAGSVVVPWGDTLVAASQAAATLLLPLAAAAITGAVARIAGPLRLLITTALVERLVRNVSDYALNAVAQAAHGRTLTVPLGSAVIARAVQRALDQAPAWLLRAAGGPRGLAEKVFRTLPLDAAADADNTLAPALQALAPPSP